MNDKTKYWLDLCNDDLLTAKALLEKHRLLHMGYYCHQIVEKALKAVIANRTEEVPPRIHDLLKLTVKGNVFEILTDDQKKFINKLTPLQIEARYPEYKEKIAAALSYEFCKKLLNETEEFLCWIKKLLGK